MKLYLVHRGFQFDKELQKTRPCNPLTYRLEKKDADGIAEALNDKLHELRYLEFLATESNVNLRGGKQEMYAVDTDANREKLKKMREEAEKDEKKAQLVNFWVSEMQLSGEEGEKVKAELEKMSATHDSSSASVAK